MIKIIQGDITTLAVDAIVNAAKRAVREVCGFLSPTENAECAENGERKVAFATGRFKRVEGESVENVLDRINKIDKIGDDENPDNPVNPVKKDYQQKAICGNECGFVDCKSGDNNFPWPDIGERGIGNDKHQKAGQTYFLMFHKSLKPLKLFSTHARFIPIVPSPISTIP